MRRHLHVFYADPGLAGSERNLALLAAWAPADRAASRLRSLEHRGERYEHVSFLRSDRATRVHCYSRASAVYRTEHVDAHLVAGADAIVMVVDARDFRVDAAVEHAAWISELAGAAARSPALVGQRNRVRPEPGTVIEGGVDRPVTFAPLEAIAVILPPHARWVDACTFDGTGVLETLRTAVSAIADRDEPALAPEVIAALEEDGISAG